jgi:hypothetical protein
VNKRDLRKALDAHAEKDDDSSGRRLAYLFANELANGGRVPRALREPLAKAAMACLACDAHDVAPAGAKPYSELYRDREWAFAQFGDAALVHCRRPRKPKETDGNPETETTV